MKKRNILVLIPALLGMLILTHSSTAQAQYYGYRPAPPPRPYVPPRARVRRPWHRTHFYVGGQLMGLVVLNQQLSDIGVLGHGGGVGLTGGVRLGRFVALEANWTFTGHDEYWGCDDHGYCDGTPDSLQIQTLTADVKFHIPTWSRLEPFIQAGGGWAFFGVTGAFAGGHGYLYTSGPTYNLGGGVDFHVGRYLTFGGRLLYRGMYFGEPNYYHNQTGRWDGNFVHGVSIDFTASLHF